MTVVKVHKQHSWSTMSETSLYCGLATKAHTTHSVLSNYVVQPKNDQLTRRTGIWRWCDETKSQCGGGKRTDEENQSKKMSGGDSPAWQECPLTTTCPVDSSGRRCRCAGRCLGWRGRCRSLWCRSQMCWAFLRNAWPAWAEEFAGWGEIWDKWQPAWGREGLEYLVCFLVFDNAAVIHGLLSVWLGKGKKKNKTIFPHLIFVWNKI